LDYCDDIRFEKLYFQNVFRPLTLKRKAGVFKFLRFQELFQKAVEGSSNRRNKAAFSIFSGARSVDGA